MSVSFLPNQGMSNPKYKLRQMSYTECHR